MEEIWKLLVCGVRGSVPMPDKDFRAYGGNTSCMVLHYGDGILIFDAGTGLLKFGRGLHQAKIKRVDILLSHLHIDHLSGLFGFPMFQDPEAEVHIYGQSGIKISEYLNILVGRPFWPVGLKDAAARIEIHEVTPGDRFYLAGKEKLPEAVAVDTLQGNHPGKSLLYRVRGAEKSLVYALDCETDEETFDALAGFSKDSDLIVWDASFTAEDLKKHKGWGHSCWEQGSSLRRRAGVKTALMTHYSQEYTDDFLRQQERMAQEADGAIRFAKEGMVIEI